MNLPVFRLRRDLLALLAITLGVSCLTALYWQLASKRYNHWSIVLFVGGLSLFGLAVHRLDTHTPSSSLRVTRYDCLGAFGLAIVSGALTCIDLTDWKFSFIGDEYIFFDTARAYAGGDKLDVFNLHHVYNMMPSLDSIYQGLVMRLTGQVNVWGWRFSEVIVLSISVVLVYLLGVVLFGHTAGIAAGAVIGFSNYLMAFAHIGYNNIHAVAASALVMLMLALAWRTQRTIYIFLVGVTMGLCLYTIMLAMVIWLPIAVLLLIGFIRKPSWAQVVSVSLIVVAFVIVIVPGLMTTPIRDVVQATMETSHRKAELTHPWSYTWEAFSESLRFLWSNPYWRHHYMAAAAVDAVTGVLLAIGICMAFLRVTKESERIVVVWFWVGLAVIAITSYRPEPPTTRLLFLLPPIALFVALVVERIEHLFSSVVARIAVILPMLTVVPYLNMRQLLVDSPRVLGVSRPAMAMKAVQEHPQYTVIEVGMEPENDTAALMKGYPWLSSRYRFVNINEIGTPSTEGRERHLPIYMVDQDNQDLVQQVVTKLPRSYRITTDRDPAGNRRTTLFVCVTEDPKPGPGGSRVRADR